MDDRNPKSNLYQRLMQHRNSRNPHRVCDEPVAGSSRDSNQGAEGLEDSDQECWAIPDTPSPVFNNKIQKPHFKHDHRPTPASRSLGLSSENSQETKPNCKDKSGRRAALQRLKDKRQKLTLKNDRQDTDSDEEFLEEHLFSFKLPESGQSKNSPLDDSDDSADLDLLPFESMRSESNRHQAEAAAAAAGPSATATANSDSSDISEGEFDEFISGLIGPGDASDPKFRVPQPPNSDNSKRKGKTVKNPVRKKQKSSPQPSPSARNQPSQSTISKQSQNSVNDVIILDDSLDQFLADISDSPMRIPQPRRSSRNGIGHFGARHPISSSTATSTSSTSQNTFTAVTPLGRRLVSCTTSTPLEAAAQSSHIMPSSINSRRNATSPTLVRISGLRRRGSRTMSGAQNSSITVSPATLANHQVAEDEALAKRLQEEMDREFAATLEGSSASPRSATRQPARSAARASAAPGNTPAGRSARVRQMEASRDYDAQMFMLIGGLTDDEWNMHQEEYRNRRRSAAGRHGNRRSNTPAGRSARVRQMEASLDYDAQMFMLIGGLTDDEWNMHQEEYRNRGRSAAGRHGNHVNTEVVDFLEHYQYQRRHVEDHPPPERSPVRSSARRTGAATRSSHRTSPMRQRDRGDVDPEILNYMRYVRNSRQRTSQISSRGATRQRIRRAGRNADFLSGVSFNADDYEGLLNLAETIGDVKAAGLTDQQISMLPTKPFCLAQVGEEGSKECNICMVDYEELDTLRLLQCFHYFHAGCIDKWLKEKASCPICRECVKFD